MNAKQQRFVDEYLIDLNATQAAIRAGYSVESAYSQGQRLLKKAEVAAALETAMAARAKRTEITADMVLQELAKLGFSDIRRAVQWRANVTAMVEDPETGEQRLAVTNEVQLIDSDKLDDATGAAVAEVSQTAQGGLKLKFHDKKGALDLIGKHLGMFVERRELSGPGGAPINAQVITADATPDQAAEIYRKLLG